MGAVELKAIDVIARGEWPDRPTHGTWRAECMIAWLKEPGIELVDASVAREASKALREIADEAEACRTREIPMELGWLRRRAERALGERS